MFYCSYLDDLCDGMEVAIQLLPRFLQNNTLHPFITSSIEGNANIRIRKALTIVNMLMPMGKSNLSEKIKWEFFQAIAMSVLLYGSTTWTLMICQEKKLEDNIISLILLILNL